jgi:hypothetical protein
MAALCSYARKKRVAGFGNKKMRKNGAGCLSPSRFGEDSGKRNTEQGKCCAWL